MDFFKSYWPFLAIGVVLGSVLWYTCGWVVGLIGLFAPISTIMLLMYYIMRQMPK